LGYTKPRVDGTKDAVRRIGRTFLSLLAQLEKQKYQLSKTAVMSIPGSATVAAASLFPVEYDLHGNRLALRKRGEDTPEAALSVIPEPTQTHVVFLWHRRHEGLLRPFFSELAELDLVAKKRILSQMILSHCENASYSPRLVESWTEQETAAVVDLFASTIYRARPYDKGNDICVF
jgi:hypothetical protein